MFPEHLSTLSKQGASGDQMVAAGRLQRIRAAAISSDANIGFISVSAAFDPFSGEMVLLA
jgi:hypothetical protein